MHNYIMYTNCINSGSASLIKLASVGGVSTLSVTMNIILFTVVIVQCILISKRTTTKAKTGYQGGKLILAMIPSGVD